MTAKGMRAAVTLLAAVVLAGCGTDLGRQQQAGVFKSLTSKIGKHGTAQGSRLTRAQIAAVGKPLLLVAAPAKNLRAYLTRLSSNGAVVTWKSTDARTVSLKDGVLIQTRGLGADLMSAAVPSPAALRRGSGTVPATYYFLDGNDQSYAVPVSCQLTDHGGEAVTIAEISYRLHHVSAVCHGGTARFTNDYWFDSRQKIRQSRQWVSPSLGVFEFVDLAP